jgi:hypothetical protein
MTERDNDGIICSDAGLTYDDRLTLEMTELVKKAKKLVAEWCGGWTGRPWVEVALDSYENSRYRVALMVYEGSPAKGTVVADYGNGTVTAISQGGQSWRRWRTKTPGRG